MQLMWPAWGTEASAGGDAVFLESPKPGFLELEINATGALQESIDQCLFVTQRTFPPDFFEVALAAKDLDGGVEILLQKAR